MILAFYPVENEGGIDRETFWESDKDEVVEMLKMLPDEVVIMDKFEDEDILNDFDDDANSRFGKEEAKRMLKKYAKILDMSETEALDFIMTHWCVELDMTIDDYINYKL